MLSIFLALLSVPFLHSKMNSDALIGSWKMVPEKSQYKNTAKPKDLTVNAHLEGKDLIIDLAGTDASGKRFEFSSKQPAQGGPIEFLTDAVDTSDRFESASYVVENANKMQMQYLQGTFVVATRTIEISKDHTTAIMKYNSKPTGRSTVSTEVKLRKIR